MTFEEISHFISGNKKGNKNRRRHSVFLKKINGKIGLTGRVDYLDENVRLPQNLVRYFSLEKHNIEALKQNYLWASDPLKFNDILDCSILHWNYKSFTKENLNEVMGEEDNKIIEGKNQLENRKRFVGLRLHTMGVACLNSGKNQDLFGGIIMIIKVFVSSLIRIGWSNLWESLPLRLTMSTI